MCIALVAVAVPPVRADGGAALSGWRLFHPEKGSLDGGVVRLSPTSEAWNRSSAISTTAVDLWAGTGAVVRTRITLRATVAGADRDVSGFIGFTPHTKADTVQGADNVVGLALDYSRASRRIRVALVRKEKNGENPDARGNEWGDLSEYPGTARTLPSEDGAVDVALGTDGSRFEATVAQGNYAASVAAGLTRGLWKRAFVFAQCGSTADGSGTMTVESTSLTGTSRAVVDEEEPDSLRRPPDAAQIPDQVTLRAPKPIGANAFSVGGPSFFGEGKATLESKP